MNCESMLSSEAIFWLAYAGLAILMLVRNKWVHAVRIWRIRDIFEAQLAAIEQGGCGRDLWAEYDSGPSYGGMLIALTKWKKSDFYGPLEARK